MTSKRRSIPNFLKKAEVDPKAVPGGIDRQTYFAGPIPEEVRLSVPLLHDLPPEVGKSMVYRIIEAMIRSEGVESESMQLLHAVMKKGFPASMTDPTASIIITGLHSLLQTCITQKVRPKQFESDLALMNVPQSIISVMVGAVGKVRSELESAALSRRLRCPQISKFRWRIDVTLSTGLLSKVMRPSILVQMALSSGTIKTFEISIEQFNQLRYSVAKVLQEMQRVERHPILRIINDDERKDKIERCKVAEK